jgi:hypothetical protein
LQRGRSVMRQMKMAGRHFTLQQTTAFRRLCRYGLRLIV